MMGRVLGEQPAPGSFEVGWLVRDQAGGWQGGDWLGAHGRGRDYCAERKVCSCSLEADCHRATRTGSAPSLVPLVLERGGATA